MSAVAAAEGERKILIEEYQIEGGPPGIIGYDQFRQDIAKQRETNERIKKIAIAAGIIIGIVIIGGAAAFVLAAKISLAYVGPTAILIAIVAAGIFVRKYSKAKSSAIRNFNAIFIDILASEGGQLTPAKIKIFQEHGQHCTKLRLENHFETGIELGCFFNWMSTRTTCDMFRATLRDALSEDQKKAFVSYLLPALSDLATIIREQEAALSEASLEGAGNSIQGAITTIQKAVEDVKTAVVAIDDKKPALYTGSLATAGDVATIIESCPNLESVNLGYCFHPDVIAACRQIPFVFYTKVSDFTIDDIASMLEERKQKLINQMLKAHFNMDPSQVDNNDESSSFMPRKPSGAPLPPPHQASVTFAEEPSDGKRDY